MKKKLLILAMALIAIVCLAVSVSAVEYNGVHYTLDSDGTATVSADNRTATNTVAVIPETFEYEGETYTVDAFANYAFANNTTVETVVIYPKLESLAPYAFQGATSLKKVYIDFSNVKTIGQRAMTLATKDDMNPVSGQEFKLYTPESYTAGEDVEITTVNFDKVISIGAGAFNNTSLKYVTIGKNCETIGIQTFRFSDLIEITVESNADIPNYFCGDVANITKIKLGSPTSIGSSAFTKCKDLQEIRVDMSQVKSVSGNSFCFSSQYDGGNNTAQWYNLNGEKIVDLSSLQELNGGGQSGSFASSNLGSAKIIWPKAITKITDQCFRKCNINQPIYLNAAEGANLTVDYWCFNGNTPQLFVLGPGITTFKGRIEAECTLVSLANSVEFTDSVVLSKSDSFFYGKAYTGTDIDSKSNITVNTISSYVANNYGACGIDCSVTLASDGSIVVLSVPVHTWDEGKVDESYCPIGSVVDFDCVYCTAAKTEGEGTEHDHSVAVIVYENGFMKKGTKTFKCSNTECSSILDEAVEAVEIFAFRGYSYSEIGTGALISSFAVNHKALEAYNNSADENDKITSYGLVAAVASNVTDGNPLADGTKNATVEFYGKIYDIFEMKINGLSQHSQVPVYCTAYITVGDKNTFVDNGEIKERLETAYTFEQIKGMIDNK